MREDGDIWPGTHAGVVSMFGEHLIKTGVFPVEMGRDLARAMRQRQAGEYDVSLTVPKAEAEELLTTATVFVERIERSLD